MNLRIERKREESEMHCQHNAILHVQVSWDRAEALCNDGTREVKVMMAPLEKKYAVILGKKVEEEYENLPACMHSRYADVFVLLRRELNVMNRYSSGILRNISGEEKAYEREGEVYRAVSVFSVSGGECYTAGICYDFSREVPQFSYTVSSREGEILESYDALHHAEDSYYYPAFADLDVYINQKMMEGAE